MSKANWSACARFCAVSAMSWVADDYNMIFLEKRRIEEVLAVVRNQCQNQRVAINVPDKAIAK